MLNPQLRHTPRQRQDTERTNLCPRGRKKMIRIQWNSPFGGSGLDLISDLLGTHVWTKLSNFFPSGQDFLSIPGATWVTKSKVDCCLCLMLCLLHTHKHTKTQSGEPQRRAMTGGFVKWMQKAQQTFQFLRLIGKSESLHVSPGDSVTERERDHISISKTKSSWLSSLQVYIKQTLHCRHLNMTALSVFFPPNHWKYCLQWTHSAWGQISEPFAQRGQELCRYLTLYAAGPQALSKDTYHWIRTLFYTEMQWHVRNNAL